MKLYRLLTGPDDSSFCHKVSAALAQGWELYGSSSIAFDANANRMVCSQAVVKETAGEYHPDLVLSEQ